MNVINVNSSTDGVSDEAAEFESQTEIQFQSILPTKRDHDDDDDDDDCDINVNFGETLNDDSDKNTEGCPICFEPWTTNGLHRVCSLRCGHLFGKHCIETWLSNGTRAKCPQCNCPASKKDIRILFVKKLTAMDNSERESLLRQLEEERLLRKRAQEKEVKMTLAYNLAVAELNLLRGEWDRNRQGILNEQKFEINRFKFKNSINFEPETQCRCLAYDKHYETLLVGRSDKRSATGPLKGQHGVSKISMLVSSQIEFIPIHDQLIKSIASSPFSDGMVLSTSFDKSLRLTSLNTNATVLNYQLEAPGSSCAFDNSDKNFIYVGLGNGAIKLFDIRNTKDALWSLSKSVSKAGPFHSIFSMSPNDEGQKSLLVANAMNILLIDPTKKDQFVEHSPFSSSPSGGYIGSLAFDSHSKFWSAFIRSSTQSHLLGNALSFKRPINVVECQYLHASLVRSSLMQYQNDLLAVLPDGPCAKLFRYDLDGKGLDSCVISTNNSKQILDTFILSNSNSPMEPGRIVKLKPPSHHNFLIRYLTRMSKREPRTVIEGDNVNPGKRPPFPKRKVAIMMGYCGSNYQGMQLNPNAKTIELELFNALCKDGLVSSDNAVDPKKISWMRACRTDKGVHAAGQVVSVKILVKTDVVPQDCEDRELAALDATVPRLNALLPPDIRVFGIKRTANSFHAKERCDSRFYEYLLPTYTLAPASASPYLHPEPKPFKEFNNPPKDNVITNNSDSDEEAEALELSEPQVVEWVSKLTEEEKNLIVSYRIDSDRIGRLRDLLFKYVGSKSFHNFTIGKQATDITARRHIYDVTVGSPFVKNEIEWISIVFHGQSFMLHQIRKMVGLVILAVRLNCNFSLLDKCFEAPKVNIPKAPALGLLLDKGVFRGYNMKFAGSREGINFDEYEGLRQNLKDTMIYPKIFEEEEKFQRFMGWLKCNDEHASEFQFLTPFISANE